MGLIFLFIKVYPVFGISLAVLSFDLARNFKRKGNRAWVGMVAFGAFFVISSIVWAVLRGDRNADKWFSGLLAWLQHG